MSLPELQQNPLVQRVIDIFDTDGNGEVDFKGMQITVFTQLHYRNKLLKHNEACPSWFSACDEERSAAESTVCSPRLQSSLRESRSSASKETRNRSFDVSKGAVVVRAADSECLRADGQADFSQPADASSNCSMVAGSNSELQLLC